MHQTTVRFGKDLWEVLEQEAERLGVSAAQYVREATLARLAYAAASQVEAVASRGAFAWAGGEPFAQDAQAPPKEREGAGPTEDGSIERAEIPLGERVEAQLESAAAVQAQGKLAREKAERLRVEAEALKKRKETRKAAVRER
jgi:hypothetical protein